MRKGKSIICSFALLVTLTSCVTVENGGAEWTGGGIGFAPLLYTSNKDGDCTSIIKGWIESANEHGAKISGHDVSDVNTADNSSNWSIEYTDQKYAGKLGILPNQITDMLSLLSQCKSIISEKQPEYLVVPCFTSEIYTGSDMENVSPETKIGAYNVWYGDPTITKLVKAEKCENTIGQHLSYALPMIHLLRNQLDGANIYEGKPLSETNIRNYFYKPWAANTKEDYLAMEILSNNYKEPALTKTMLDSVVPSKDNDKTIEDFQNFLTEADFDYIKQNRVSDSADVIIPSKNYKVGVIELNTSATLVNPTRTFYKEYVSKKYNFNITSYSNDGKDVLALVQKAKQEGCEAVIINCTDANTINAAVTACENNMYAIVCNSQVYDYDVNTLLWKDGDGKVSKYFVGAYGIALDEWQSYSKAMVDDMFTKLDV